MVVPGRSRVRAKLSGPAARQVSSQLTRHGAESPGMHCLVAAPNAGAAVANSACPPRPGKMP
eukprot:6424852-Prymnesium_polylepis.1